MSFIKKCLFVLLGCVLLLSLIPAFANAEEAGSIALSFTTDSGMAIEGNEFRAYLLSDGQPSEKGFVLTGRFEGLNIDLKDYGLTTAEQLYFYIQSEGLEADHVAFTDAEGVVHFEDIPFGLYLVVGDSAAISEGEDNLIYTPMMTIVPVPYWNDGELITDVEIAVKKDSEINTELINRGVVKIWKGADNKRPSEITVDLYKDGELYDTVTLSNENDWSHKWIGLSIYSKWVIKEREISGYKSEVVLDKDTFVVTNTLIETPGTIPSTGVLWWPVPILLIAGFTLVVTGQMLKRRDA